MGKVPLILLNTEQSQLAACASTSRCSCILLDSPSLVPRAQRWAHHSSCRLSGEEELPAHPAGNAVPDCVQLGYPPAHPRPFLPSCFPAGQPPAHTGAWGCSTPGPMCIVWLCWPSQGLHFSSLALSLPRPVCQALPCGAPSAHHSPSLWHPTDMDLSAHRGTIQAQPLCTSDHCTSRTALLQPPHLSLWTSGIFQRHPCHPKVQLRWAGKGSVGVWPQTSIQAMFCIKRRGKH